MHRGWLQRLSDRLPPNSAAAYLFGLVAIGLATVAQEAFGWLDASMSFATYFPAILLTALLAGPRAAAVAAVAAVFVVWWAFLPPRYGFGPLTHSDVANLGLFLLSSSLIVWLAYGYRQMIVRLDRNERERDLMMKELEHRGKNTFAVIEAIVRNTLGNDAANAETIVGRIRAVSSSNDIINQSADHRASLRSLLLNEFRAHGEKRVECTGTDVELSADIARNIALVIHELVTNAVKYGALSNATGRVSIGWQTEGRTLIMQWRERGGPPAATPAAYGFGTRLVIRTLKSLSGSIVPDFDKEGLSCEIRFEH